MKPYTKPFVATERGGSRKHSAPSEPAEETPEKYRHVAETVKRAEAARKEEARKAKIRAAIDAKIAPLAMRRLRKEGVQPTDRTWSTRFLAIIDDEREKAGYPY